jgi:hypothetical protein
VNPGVFFYWVTVTATVTGTNTFTIDQAITTSNFDSHFFSQANGSFVYSSGCTKIGSSINTSSGITTVTFQGVAGTTYIIGVKYDATSVKGFTAPSPGTTVHYTFTLTGFPSSTEGLDLVKK